MTRTPRRLPAAAAVAALAACLAPAASADPDPLCRMTWEKPVIWTDENGVPQHVEVSRPEWVC